MKDDKQKRNDKGVFGPLPSETNQQKYRKATSARRLLTCHDLMVELFWLLFLAVDDASNLSAPDHDRPFASEKNIFL